MNISDQENYQPNNVFCLCIDMIGSTKTGLNLSNQKFDRFNRSLVQQIYPHLTKLDLTKALLKFTGDGWLLLTKEAKNVPSLCCLAIIMANKFKEEMEKLSSITSNIIPPLRQAICYGRDIRVTLPDGRFDWVGDSARRAVRASGYCLPDEIVIDETVRSHIMRDFNVSPKNLAEFSQENQPSKKEEELILYGLENLKTDLATESEAPERYIYTLDVIGKIDEAKNLASDVSESLKTKTEEIRSSQENIQFEILKSWNRLLSGISDYNFAIELLQKFKNSGLSPNVFSYNIIINKSPTYKMAKQWLQAMRDEGIPPNVVTYNSLIHLAPDYDEAKQWLQTMRDEGIPPSVVTYSSLIHLAPDYDDAKRWLQAMRDEGIPPSVVTYSSLIHMSPDYDRS